MIFFNTNNTFYIGFPCLKCENCQRHDVNDIRDHLYFNDINESYKIWFWHGEELPSSSFHEESFKCKYEKDVGNIKEMIELKT